MIKISLTWADFATKAEDNLGVCFACGAEHPGPIGRDDREATCLTCKQAAVVHVTRAFLEGWLVCVFAKNAPSNKRGES